MTQDEFNGQITALAHELFPAASKAGHLTAEVMRGWYAVLGLMTVAEATAILRDVSERTAWPDVAAVRAAHRRYHDAHAGPTPPSNLRELDWREAARARLIRDNPDKASRLHAMTRNEIEAAVRRHEFLRALRRYGADHGGTQSLYRRWQKARQRAGAGAEDYDRNHWTAEHRRMREAELAANTNGGNR